MVLGRIGGWTPPFQLTLTQIGVLLAVFAGLTWTWAAWAPFLPGTVSLMVALGAPAAAAWAARRVRIEGRSLPRAAAGRLALWCSPVTGRVGGKPYRPARPRLDARRIWIAESRPEP